MKKKPMSEKRLRILALLSKITDYLLVGLLSFVISLPVLTLGAAAAAFYAVGKQLQSDEGGSAYRTYFAAFRQYGKRATLLWLPFLGGALLLTFNALFYWYMAANGAAWAQFGLGVCAAVALLLSLAGAFLFPMLVTEPDKGGLDLAKRSLYLAAREPLWWAGKTAVQLAALAAVWFVPFLIVFIPGLLLFWDTFCFSRTYRKRFPKIKEESAKRD
ncbi:MAG: DUF624 domain-containing protein [Clostridia bacterium]|nr:DUF624 domain-containing protein [Clostridia bacterium]